MSMEALIAAWDGEGVVVRHDAETGTWMFIALHDLTLGSGVGGCRMRVYPTPADGLRDAMRLAAGMTEKWAVIGFPVGGAKAVLAIPKPLEGAEREGLLRRFGRLVESLRGTYGTGEDLGTTPEDMAIVGEETRFAHGRREGEEPIDPGPYTALGVFMGMRAALARVHGEPTFAGRSVLVQGVGDVGAPLAGLLARAGARVLASDVDARRAERVAGEAGGDVVVPEEVYATSCDVLAPCAIGGVLSPDTVPRLRCRIVAGSANNQLAEDRVADDLHGRGILYVPDFVINAGGAIALPLVDRGVGEDRIRSRIDRIQGVVDKILAEAAASGESPLHAARRRVQRVLEAGPEGLSFE